MDATPTVILASGDEKPARTPLTDEQIAVLVRSARAYLNANVQRLRADGSTWAMSRTQYTDALAEIDRMADKLRNNEHRRRGTRTG